MWKPGDVVPEHKTRAKWVWAALLAAMFIYIIWQIAAIAIKRENPSTSLTLTDDPYDFPLVQICFWEGRGCGYEDDTLCVASALNSTTNSAIYGDQEIPMTGGEFINCVAVDLREINVDDESGQEANGMRTALITVIWQLADTLDEDEPFSESIGFYMGAEKSDDEASYERVFLPHGRFEYDGEVKDVPLTELTIGKNVREFISGKTVTTFPAATIATTTFVLSVGVTVPSPAYGILSVSLNQGSYSLSNVKDVDPLELGSFLGNLGGFWELLLIMWGLCFIATRQSDPGLKARNFKKSIKRGADLVSQRNSISRRTSSVSESEEARPVWESAYRRSTSEQRASNNGTSVVGIPAGFEHRGRDTDASTSAASSRRPIARHFPQRNPADASGRSSQGVGSPRSNQSRTQGDSKVHESIPPPSYNEHCMA